MAEKDWRPEERIRHLGVTDGDIETAMPEWCSFLAELAARTSRMNDCKQRAVVAVSVPTRAYAAVMAALGAVLERAQMSVDGGAEPHFERLSTLEPGTKISLRTGEAVVQAKFLGVREDDGEPRIGAQVGQGNTAISYWLPKAQAIRIRVRTSGAVDPKTRQRVRMSTNLEALRQIMGVIDVTTYVLDTRLETVVVGTVATLTEEIMSLQLSASEEHEWCELKDALRVQGLVPAGTGYRSVLLPVVDDEIEVPGEAPLAIFDGAAGYLKWRDRFKRCNWLVVLDRSEHRFEEAIDLLNMAFVERQSELELPGLRDVPSGIEAMALSERR